MGMGGRSGTYSRDIAYFYYETIYQNSLSADRRGKSHRDVREVVVFDYRSTTKLRCVKEYAILRKGFGRKEHLACGSPNGQCGAEG